MFWKWNFSHRLTLLNTGPPGVWEDYWTFRMANITQGGVPQGWTVEFYSLGPLFVLFLCFLCVDKIWLFFLREERMKNIFELKATGEEFLYRTPLAQALRSKHGDLMKLRSFCTAKGSLIQAKWLPTEWANIFTNYISDCRHSFSQHGRRISSAVIVSCSFLPSVYGDTS